MNLSPSSNLFLQSRKLLKLRPSGPLKILQMHMVFRVKSTVSTFIFSYVYVLIKLLRGDREKEREREVVERVRDEGERGRGRKGDEER